MLGKLTPSLMALILWSSPGSGAVPVRPDRVISSAAIGLIIPRTNTLPDPGRLTWLKEPSASDAARLYPPDARGDVYVRLKCHLHPNGKLSPCEPEESDPVGQDHLRAGKLLSHLYVARTDDLQGGVENVWFVVLSIKLSDGAFTPERCFPPFCVPTPPPPLAPLITVPRIKR